MRWLLRLVLAILFICLVLASAIAYMDNEKAVALRFLQWHTPVVSIYWWMLLSLSIGFILGMFLTYATTLKVRVSERKSRRELHSAQRELDTLKDAPVQVSQDVAKMQ
ncbi:MAG: LapA family protein [Pseudomonadales bacterium]|nr:LapA family protein [Pseudomonadales bacterium]